jgi:hypothetical protein
VGRCYNMLDRIPLDDPVRVDNVRALRLIYWVSRPSFYRVCVANPAKNMVNRLLTIVTPDFSLLK